MENITENTNRFSRPQRQAPVGVLIEIIYSFQKLIRKFWPILIIVFVRLKTTGLIYSLLIVIVLLIIVAIIGYLNFKNFLFYLDDKNEEFILEKGIFDKKRTVIKLPRIQQVNINQSFLQKLIDVYEIEIETAGSTKKEVKINAVSKDVAIKMRSLLLTEFKTSINKETIAEKPVEDNLFIKISSLSLLKVALTSDYFKSLGVIAVFLVAVYDKLKDVFINDKESENKIYDYFSKFNFQNYILIIFAAAIIFIFIFNLVRTFLIYYDFKISLKNKSLQFSFGLINNKSILIQPFKVQKITKTQNFFQKKLNVERINITQASSNIEKDKKAAIHIPGLNENEANNLLELIYDEVPKKGDVLRPTVYRIFSSIYKLLIPALIFMIISFINSDWNIFLISIPFYFVITAAMIYYSFKNNKLFIHNSFIIKQSGIWDIKTAIITPEKIQAITTKQYLWQIKSDVGHIKLHTAGGDIVFKFANFKSIKNYTNKLLYQVESSNREWM